MFIIALSYLLGSLPLGFISRRYNALRLPPGLISIAADFAKGFLIVLLAPKISALLAGAGLGFSIYPLQNPAQISAAALVSATLGHCFSVYVCGWGGLGVSLVFGGFLVMTPKAAITSLSLLALTLLILRKIRYASLVGAIALPFMVLWRYPEDFVYFWAAAFSALFMVLTHVKFINRP